MMTGDKLLENGQSLKSSSAVIPLSKSATIHYVSSKSSATQMTLSGNPVH